MKHSQQNVWAFLGLIKKSIHNLIVHFFQRMLYFGIVRWFKVFFSARVINHRMLPQLDRPLVIIANHQSNWDAFLMISTFRTRLFLRMLPLRFPAYHRFFEKLSYRIFFALVGGFPITPRETLEESLSETMQLMDEGYNLIFFPEGKRVARGKQVSAKKGIGYLAKHTSCYILPMYVEYTHHGRDGFGVRVGSRATIVYGEIIPSETFAHHDDQVRHEVIMEQVWLLKKQYAAAPTLPEKFKESIQQNVDSMLRKSPREEV